MNYVMVPVPEHHERAFGVWLLQLTMRAALATWSPQKIQATAERLLEDERRIVARVAEVQGFWIDAGIIADELGLEVDDLIKRVNTMNHECFEAESPAIVMVKAAEQSRTGRAMLMMDGSIRKDVLAALAAVS